MQIGKYSGKTKWYQCNNNIPSDWEQKANKSNTTKIVKWLFTHTHTHTHTHTQRQMPKWWERWIKVKTEVTVDSC